MTQGFSQPKPGLEQYATPGSLAARLVTLTLLVWSNLQRALDLAAGTGRLGLGMAVQGVPSMLVEVDEAAIRVCRENIRLLEEWGVLHAPVECVQADALTHPLPRVDVVLLNPPFGKRGRHLDRLFLARAFELAPRVAAILPPPREAHARIARQHGFTLLREEEHAFPIPFSMPWHTKPRKDTRVLLMLFEKNVQSE